MRLRSRLKLLVLGVITAAGTALTGVATTADAGPRTAAQSTTIQVATAEMYDPAGIPRGVVTFIQSGGVVRVTAEIHSLTPGFHGFHIHTTGNCSTGDGPAFAAAGGHWEPHGRSHPHHGGDMPSLFVHSSGVASLSFTTDYYRLEELFDSDGSAVIIHDGPDNFANIPTRYATEPDAATLATGDSGARVACGVVWPAE